MDKLLKQKVDAYFSCLRISRYSIRTVLSVSPFSFGELQACSNCATSLKFFKLDGRFDVNNSFQHIARQNACLRNHSPINRS